MEQHAENIIRQTIKAIYVKDESFDHSEALEQFKQLSPPMLVRAMQAVSDALELEATEHHLIAQRLMTLNSGLMEIAFNVVQEQEQAQSESVERGCCLILKIDCVHGR